jgi:ribosomal protein L37E
MNFLLALFFITLMIVFMKGFAISNDIGFFILGVVSCVMFEYFGYEALTTKNNNNCSNVFQTNVNTTKKIKKTKNCEYCGSSLHGKKISNCNHCGAPAPEMRFV